MGSVSSEASSLPLAKRFPFVPECLRHITHFFLIEGVIDRLVSVLLRASVASPSGRRRSGRGPLRLFLVHTCHNPACGLFWEPVQRGDVLHTPLEVVFDVEGEVLQPEDPMTMIPCCVENNVATGASGRRRWADGFATQFLLPGGHQLVTHGCATQAVGMEHVCSLPWAEFELMGLNELNAIYRISELVNAIPPVKLASAELDPRISFSKPWVPEY